MIKGRPIYLDRQHRQKGYALLLVLWSLILLSLMSAMLISQNRLAVRMEANAWRDLQAEETAEAALAIGVLSLFEPETHTDGSLYGAMAPFEFDGVQGEISIQDELGKVDLNSADERLLRSLLLAGGASPSEAELLASRIIEWRGSRDLRRPFAVVKEEYEKAQLSYTPRGTAFQSVDELKLVLGMGEELFEELRPAITIYTHSSAFDPNAAPELLLRAAPGLSAAKVQDVLSKRRTLAAKGPTEEQKDMLQLRIPLDGRAFTIGVRFELDGRQHVKSRVIRIAGGQTNPVWVLE